MEEIKKYLKDALGIDIEFNSVKADYLKSLPIYITSTYDFQLIKLYRQDILLVFVKHDFTTDSLRKHLDIIRTTLNIITVAVIRQLESFNRLRLIEKKVPFIIPGKQMYLPDLLIELKEFGVRIQDQPQAMQPATQLLLLYHLQVEPLDEVNLKGIAEKLWYDGTTITRVAYYLHNMGICSLQGQKEKSLHFNANKKELWEKVEPLMNNPVKTTQYYSGWVSLTDGKLFKANINALAHYSDLNGDVVEYYAVCPGQLKFIGPVNPAKSNPLEGNICIEEWKYNPRLLTKNEFVDPLSLYLCFRGKPDERIEMALEQIINNIQW
jgi:hypothetical protein